MALRPMAREARPPALVSKLPGTGELNAMAFTEDQSRLLAAGAERVPSAGRARESSGGWQGGDVGGPAQGRGLELRCASGRVEPAHSPSRWVLTERGCLGARASTGVCVRPGSGGARLDTGSGIERRWVCTCAGEEVGLFFSMLVPSRSST